jgi:hypothetical protein
MPRRIVPWYRWNFDYKSFFNVLWSGGLDYLLGWILNKVSGGWTLVCVLLFAIPLLLLPVFLGWNLVQMWRNRHPFDFTARGRRKIRFTPHFRDEIIYEEADKRVVIFSGLMVGRIERLIDGTSVTVEQWPKTNAFSESDQLDILNLLCEYYEYRGTVYEVTFDNSLFCKIQCPACLQESNSKVEIWLGSLPPKEYELGERYDWVSPQFSYLSRPTNGTMDMMTYTHCPHCKRTLEVTVHIKEDYFDSMDVKLEKERKR